jgi:DNA-binding NtrC family response regulator
MIPTLPRSSNTPLNTHVHMNHHLLIIDDNPEVCKSLLFNFARHDYATAYVLNAADALAHVMREPVDVAILDLRLGADSGLELLPHLLALKSDLPVIILTGFATIRTAVEAIKAGAYDYVEKPVNFQKLLSVVERALTATRGQSGDAARPRAALDFASRIITQNAAMIEVCIKAKKLAAGTIPVLILGESGTGKELIAEFVHQQSPRSDRDLLTMNCSAFPETLIDNELFGHEKGAFSGASGLFQGVFERADRSSLFLDEIADMSLTTQAKILRAIQNQEIRRIGGQDVIRVDVRLIGATNKDVAQLVRERLFREDLYYRLNAAILHVPPLRRRKDDVLLLAEHFLRDLARTQQTPQKTLSAPVIALFHDYDWPGNVRELKNMTHYAAAMSQTGVIEVADLPAPFQGAPTEAARGPVRDAVEKNLILATLKQTGYNKKKAAELLNMSRRTLYNKLEKYGLAPTQ